MRKSHRTQAYAKVRSAFFPRISFGTLLPKTIRHSWRAYLEGGQRAKVELPAEWLDRIKSYYRSDNRKLASEYGLPLESYGYPL